MEFQKEDFFFDRPLSGERIPLGQRELPHRQEKLFDGEPKIGLVISTYGAAAYVELALAVRQRFYPTMPALVHDDASPQREQLIDLCKKYGATYQSNSAPLGHEMGDLSSFVGALTWGRSAGLDIVVKMSRRFVPTVDWVGSLKRLATASQHISYGRPCAAFDYPLRTECFAMAVKAWCETEALSDMTGFLLNNRRPFSVEEFVFSSALKAYEMMPEIARKFELKFIHLTPKPPFVRWDFLTDSRRERSTNYLWHDTSPPAEYRQLSQVLGLSYPVEAFMGFQSAAGA